MPQKPATIKEIAKQLKVSVSTVSRALHDHPSIGLRTKMQVQKLAQELNYEPNQAAISFKQGKTNTIGLILPNLGEEFFSIAINGIEDAAIRNSYTVLIGQSRDDMQREIQIADTMRKHRVDGLLVSLAKNTTSFDHFDQLSKYNIPVVFFDRVPDDAAAYTVSCDLKNSSELLVDWLVQQGHTAIGFIKGPDTMPSTLERMQGYFAGLKKNGLPVIEAFVVATDLDRENTKAAVKKLLKLKNRPTALIAFNDYVALDAMKFIRSEGLEINKDISIVSYANLPVTSYLDSPPVASIEQFPYQQAEKAATLLLELIGRKEDMPATIEKKIVLKPELVTHPEQRGRAVKKSRKQ
ncbi:MAG TPA: LacI family DNA-binding transcriptional regulator [Chitinophagaceae bacterium]|nr:LacI family DNA-binding transcriptional regulator [Chitinophagaceae bacterium]